jgi:hypothetical protein
MNPTARARMRRTLTLTLLDIRESVKLFRQRANGLRQQLERLDRDAQLAGPRPHQSATGPDDIPQVESPHEFERVVSDGRARDEELQEVVRWRLPFPIRLDPLRDRPILNLDERCLPHDPEQTNPSGHDDLDGLRLERRLVATTVRCEQLRSGVGDVVPVRERVTPCLAQRRNLGVAVQEHVVVETCGVGELVLFVGHRSLEC